jgi:hypothetical protein
MTEQKDPSEMISAALSSMDDFEKANEALIILKQIGWLSDHDHERVDGQILKDYASHPKAAECGSWSQLYSEIEESMREEFLQNVGSAYLNRQESSSNYAVGFGEENDEHLSSITCDDTDVQSNELESRQELKKPQSSDQLDNSKVTDDKTITLEKALEYIESNADGECFNGCTEIDIKAAEKLASYEDILYLDVLKQVPLDCLKILVKHVGGYLSLNGLNQLSKEDAKCLAEFEGDLCLNGIHEISDEVAELLSQHKGDIELNNLSHVSASCAKALQEHESVIHLDSLSGSTDCADTFVLVAKNSPGVPSLNELSECNAKLLVGLHEGLELNGLRDLKVETAEVLAMHTGIIQLNGIEEISNECLNVLASFKGKEISLNGLNHISKQTASCFKAFKTELLRLDGIKFLEEEPASILSDVTFKLSFSGIDTNAFKQLSEPLAKFFSKVDRNLNFPNLTSLDATSAKWLSESKGTSMSLNSLEQLTPEVATFLSEYQGNHLIIDSIKSLSEEVAGALTKFKGITLSLNGVKSLTPKVAENLANGGGRLTLKGLADLPDAAAKALSRFNGDLRLSDDLQAKVDAYKKG